MFLLSATLLFAFTAALLGVVGTTQALELPSFFVVESVVVPSFLLISLFASSLIFAASRATRSVSAFVSAIFRCMASASFFAFSAASDFALAAFCFAFSKAAFAYSNWRCACSNCCSGVRVVCAIAIKGRHMNKNIRVFFIFLNFIKCQNDKQR